MKKRVNDKLRLYWRILESSLVRFIEVDVLTQSAALAFYMIISLPSILLIILWTAARFYREAEVQAAIFSEIGNLVGEEGAHQLMTTVSGLNIREPTWLATVIGIGILLFTATTVLVTTQSILNHIFEFKPVATDGLGIWGMVRDRITSFTLLVVLIFLLLVSLVVDALISMIGVLMAKWLGLISDYLITFESLILDVGATTVLFALFFRYLPGIRLKWKDTWSGAFLTALLFSAGQHLIGFYIGSSSTADLYEAAGSILVMMLWIYYASAIFLFGATFTYMRSKMMQSDGIKPITDS
jgi:membrane protein